LSEVKSDSDRLPKEIKKYRQDVLGFLEKSRNPFAEGISSGHTKVERSEIRLGQAS